MASKSGVIVGILLAMLIVGALAGTPFYLRTLQSEPRALDAAVEQQVENVRRAVLNLDEDTAAFVSMTASAEKPRDKSADNIYRTGPGDPSDDPVFSKELIRDLNSTIELLQRVQEKDKERGTTVYGTETIERRHLKVDRSTEAFEKKYRNAHQVLMRTAETELNNLRNVSRGTSSAAGHLGVNRIKGIYLLAKGRIEGNKAQFERFYAAQTRRAAQEMASPLADLRRQAANLEAQSPTERLADIDKRLKETQAGLGAIEGAIGQLTAAIKAKQDQLDDAKKTASETQESLSRLGSQRLAFNEFSTRYLELSSQIRQAEATAAALQFGTLRDAKRVEQMTAEPTTPKYEGGTVEPGLETLQFWLEGIKEQQAVLQNMHKDLEKQRASLSEIGASLATQKESVAKQIEGATARLREFLADADSHDEKAAKAEDDAIKAFKEAMRAAKDAATAAKKLVADARQAAGAVDERLQRVSQDVDLEASMDCLVAECAYAAGLLRCEHAAAMRERILITQLIAKVAGEGSTSATDDVEKIRTDAANDVADALKAYDQAAALIGKASIKSGNVTISGKNYLWQVQVSQAAAHLLLAAIHSEQADKAGAERTLAYNLLKDAAEKREQSPLLTPAIDTLLYLQKSAR